MSDPTPQALTLLKQEKFHLKGRIAMAANVLNDEANFKKLYNALMDELDPAKAPEARLNRLEMCDINKDEAESIRAEMDKAGLTDKVARQQILMQLIYQRMMDDLADYNDRKNQTDAVNRPKKEAMKNKLVLMGEKANFFARLHKELKDKKLTTLSEFQAAVGALPNEVKDFFEAAQERADARRIYMDVIAYADPNAVPFFAAKLKTAQDKLKLSPEWPQKNGKPDINVARESVVELDRQTDYHPTGKPGSKPVNLMRVNNCVLGRKEFVSKIYNNLDSDKISGTGGPHESMLNGKDNPARHILFKTSADENAPVWGICAKVENELIVFYKYKLEDRAAHKSMKVDDFIAAHAQPMYGYDFDAKLCDKSGNPLDPDDGYKYSTTVRELVSETPRHVCEYAKMNVIDANHNVIMRGPADAAGVKVNSAKKGPMAGASAFSAQADAATSTPPSQVSVQASSSKPKTR